jgi:branched-chain amino acid transport system substrate-binding protein
VAPMRSVLAVLAAGVLLLAGCSADTDTGGGDGTTLKIGLINPTSGAASWAGVPVSQGAQTAIDEINESGYLDGYTLELTTSDSEGDPAKAISQYRGFESDGHLAVICCTISSEAGSFAQLAEASGMPTVTNGATLAGLNAPPYLYRTVVLPAAPGGMYEQVVDAVVEEEDIETAVVVQTADNEGNVADADRWIEDLEAHGVDVIEVVDTFQADTDFTVPATKIVSLDPDLVVFSTQGPKSATMIKLLRERDFDGIATSSYGVAVPSVWDVGGASLAGTIFPVPFSPLGESDRTQAFVDRYSEQWGEQPDLYSAQGYNAVWFIAEGIRAAGADVDREALAEALAGIEEFELVSGNVVEMVDGQATLADQVLIAQWNSDGTQSLWP